MLLEMKQIRNMITDAGKKNQADLATERERHIWRRESARKGLNSTSGAQFAALPLVKLVVWFAPAVVNWRSRSVAKTAYYFIRRCASRPTKVQGKTIY